MSSQTKILIVDDNEMSLDMLELILSRADCSCIRAGNGQEALACLQKDPDVDVIALDLLMPVMDGFQLLELLNKDSLAPSIPVIVISGDTQSVVRVLAMGAQDFIAKPFNPEEVVLRVQNLARVKREAEEASQARNEFIAAISHELRTPLNGITGLADILVDQVRSGTARDHLHELQGQIGGLASMINNMLDFFSLESGSCRLSTVPFNLADIMEQAVSALDERARAKSVSLDWTVSSDLVRNLTGFPDRLRKAFINIISNAIKLSPAGGTVQINVQQTRDSETICSYLCSVRDNGIGIDLEELHEILYPSVQGTGLGSSMVCKRFGEAGIELVVAMRLIRSIGGTITVENEPGQGSLFLISFDARPDPAARQAAVSLESAVSQESTVSLKVLLVEDHPLNQKIASWQLAKLGHQVTVACNGQEALELWRNNSFDLIFMDIHMPVMDGLAATQAIRAEEQGTGSHIPIIALTAYGSETGEADCLQTGMDSFITKPTKPADLLCAILQTVLRRGGHADS